MGTRRIVTGLMLVAVVGLAAAEGTGGTPLSWPAGEVDLRQALERLTAAGNTTVLPLGLDDGRRAELPALDGDYWSGVLAVCRAFDLHIVSSPPPTGRPGPWAERADGNGLPAGCRFGPVCLEPLEPGRPPPTYHANGLWLFEARAVRCLTARRLTGTLTWVEADVVLHCEPRIDRQEVRGVRVGWTGATAGDRQLALGPPPALAPSGADAEATAITLSPRHLQELRQLVAQGHQLPPGLLLQLRRAEASRDDRFTVVVRGLEADDRTLSLTGQVQLTGRRGWRAEAAAEPGRLQTVRVEGEAYELALEPAVHREVEGVARRILPPQLVVKHVGPPRIPAGSLLRARVVDAAGLDAVAGGAPRLRIGDAVQEYVFFLADLKPGVYQVFLSGIHEGGVTVSRVAGAVELP